MCSYVVYSLICSLIHSFKVLWDRENEASIAVTLPMGKL